jgi:cell division protein FtsI (penicillin-binding protein 3)
MKARRSPSMKIDLQRWRMQVVMLLIFGALIGLVGRLFYMQVFEKDFLVKQSDLRVKRKVEIPAHRGMLLDARGAHLAISIPAAAIVLNAREAEMTPAQITQLAMGLTINRAWLERLVRDKKARFVYLRRQVPAEEAEAVMALKIKGVSSQPEYRRYYTAGYTMAQVLGVTNVEDKGLEGIEFSYQSVLAGVPGLQSVIRDRSGNVVEELDLVRLPKHGRDLTLSLNSQIQYLAYRELQAAYEKFRAKGASAVVLDARTGEILAVANYPAYNPNDRATMTQALARNHAVVDAFEPGSTMKPIFISAALERGIVKPASRYDASENLVLSGKQIRDTHPKGVISVAEAIQVSSNVVMAKIAGSMRDSDIHDIYTRSGFGKLPGSGLPGETRGQLRGLKTKWLPIEKGTLAYGHGLSISLLQLARAYTIFANDGLLMPLTVEKRSAPVAGERVISQATAQQVRVMLEMVTQEGGTAPKARVPGYRVAGKTGTAHKLIDGSFAGNRYYASFVGMAPASDPRVVIAVMVDEPSTGAYYAGEVAAPVFSRIMAGTLRFLALPPDAPMESLPPVRTPVVAEAV